MENPESKQNIKQMAHNCIMLLHYKQDKATFCLKMAFIKTTITTTTKIIPQIFGVGYMNLLYQIFGIFLLFMQYKQEQNLSFFFA